MALNSQPHHSNLNEIKEISAFLDEDNESKSLTTIRILTSRREEDEEENVWKK